MMATASGSPTVGSIRGDSAGDMATPTLESTVRYLGIEVDDALAISEQTEI